MNSDFRLAVNFASHPKLVKLRRRLGAEAVLGWVCLLSYASANRSDGRLVQMDAEDIAIAAQYPADGESLVNAMLELRLLDRDGDDLVIHDWEERNPWAAKEQERGELARRSARSRWAGTTPEQRSQEMRRVRAGESPATCERTSSDVTRDVPATCERMSATCDATCSSPFLSKETDLARKESSSGEEDLKHNESGGAAAPSAPVLFPESQPKTKPAGRGTRLGEDFVLTPDRERFALGLGLREPKTVFRKFQNHWMNKPGRDGLKLDWNRTWENWCYGEVERQPAKVVHLANSPPAQPLGPAYRPASEVARERFNDDELRQIRERRQG